jgi:mono/diheme cytochrome c family protein
MPAFDGAFTDAELADIVAYVRARYSEGAPWPKLAAAVAKARKEGGAE